MAIEKLDLSKSIPEATPVADVKNAIFDLVEKLMGHPNLPESKRAKLARLRAFIDINLKDI